MALIAELNENEKPREKALRYGLRCLSTAELLALILRTGTKGQSVLETAEQLLKKSKGISGIQRMSVNELASIRGISKVKAVELAACFEISRRALCETAMESDVMNSPQEIVRWLQSEIGNEVQEKFMVLYLDTHNRIISWRVLFVGTINQSAVYPREIFREALLCGSTHVILVHNHPAGDLTPSMNDIAMTQRMMEAGRLMGVRVLDHLIVTSSGWYSIAAETLDGGMEQMRKNDIINRR